MKKVSVLRKTLIFVVAVVASYSVAHATKEIVANKGISRGGPSRPIDYANFKDHKFSYLNITILGESLVEDDSVCALACLETAPCFSFNLAAFPDINTGKLWCELLPSDKYNNSDKFVHSNYSHHFSIASPCSSWPCKNNGKCVSRYEENSYVCDCKKGFTGKNCEKDIDECVKGTHNCSKDTVCKNTKGGFNCKCKAGFTGDGHNCTDIDECVTGTHNCGNDTVCNNTKGGFNCTCKAGFTGDGHNCTDIDECVTGTHNCGNDTVCNNTKGGFNCTCKAGFIGDGHNFSGKCDCWRSRSRSPSGQWGYSTGNGRVDAIDFQTSGDVILQGYRLWGVRSGSTIYQVTIGLYRGSTLIAQRTGSYPTSSSSKTFEVVFSQGISICAGVRYTATAKIATINDSHSHNDGMASTSCSGVTVTFTPSLKDSNGSSPKHGQIPALIFLSSLC